MKYIVVDTTDGIEVSPYESGNQEGWVINESYLAFIIFCMTYHATLSVADIYSLTN